MSQVKGLLRGRNADASEGFSQNSRLLSRRGANLRLRRYLGAHPWYLECTLQRSSGPEVSGQQILGAGSLVELKELGLVSLPEVRVNVLHHRVLVFV